MKLIENLMRIVSGTLSRCRNLFYRMLGVEMEGYTWLRKVSVPRQRGDIRLGEGVSLDDGVTLLCSGAGCSGKLSIGARTYVNRNTIFDASESLVIGEDCLIGPGCYLTDHDHGRSPGEPPAGQPLVSKPTRVGDRVWMGAHVVVLKGVTIGDDALVAAGAVVTKDVPAGATVAGVPAKMLQTQT